MVWVVEVSWEICNKVGGIYTVIKSKSAYAQKTADRYITVGPYFEDKHQAEFAREDPPEEFKPLFEQLRSEGIDCHYGKWLTDVNVETILIDFQQYANHKNEIKSALWEHYQIDSLYTSFFDFDETVVWSTAAGRLIEELAKTQKIIAHCHEWLAGPAILYLSAHNVPVATVFTTHATVLGRSLIAAGVNIYDEKVDTDPQKMEPTSLRPKHQVEMHSAQQASVFTTVSHITALEAERILGRKADVILENGFNTSKFPTFEESSIRHQRFKHKIYDFLMYYFFPYYNMDLDNTLIYFMASRYEYRAKGIDLFIQSLSEMNQKLKKQKNPKNIVAFFFVPGAAQGIRSDVLRNQQVYKDIKDSLTDEHDTIMHRLSRSIITQRSTCDEAYLLGDDLMKEVRRKVRAFSAKGTPPVSTHNVDPSDAIMQGFADNDLHNQEGDPVKVILYPVYLTGSDGLLDLSYYETLQGAHLGVFPSYYEPWGYTPVEAGALGVSSITTDLSGFGRFLSKDAKQSSTPGVFVIKRLHRNDADVQKDLTKNLMDFAKFSKQDRTKNKMEAKRIASLTDWEIMIDNYKQAYKIALKAK